MSKHIQHNTMEMLDTLRNFIDHMKKNTTARSQMKVHKIAPCKTNEVNESDIHTSSRTGSEDSEQGYQLSVVLLQTTLMNWMCRIKAISLTPRQIQPQGVTSQWYQTQ